jgi:hypothetical protein
MTGLAAVLEGGGFVEDQPNLALAEVEMLPPA